jgi:chromosome segregation ATPase
LDALILQYSDFIEANADRLPPFQTSSAAESELRKLSSKLQDLKAQQRAELDSRLAGMSRQRQSLLDDEEGIEKLRSISKEATDRENQEYSQIMDEIDDIKSQLLSLQKQNSARKHATNSARERLELAKSDLEAQSATRDQLTRELKRLQQLEKQTNQELRALDLDMRKNETEETAVTELEEQVDDTERQLRDLRGEIAARREVLDSKRDSLQKLLTKIEDLEDQIDLAADGKPIRMPVDSDDSEGHEPAKIADLEVDEEEDLDYRVVADFSNKKSPPLNDDSDDSLGDDAVQAIKAPLADTEELRGRVEKVTDGVTSSLSNEDSF